MDKKTFENSRLLGDFELSGGQKIFGELNIDGSRTLLKLRSEREIPPQENPQTIHGRLHDLRKVSCLQCVGNYWGHSTRRDEGSYHHANVFPHFVTIGSNHLHPEQSSIQSVHFASDDLASIFYDFDAFGLVYEAESLIERVVRARKSSREIKTGAAPIVAYFAGKQEIIGVDTDIGRVSVSHLPNPSMGGPEGISIYSQMMVTINAKSPMTFKECVSRIQTVVRFLSLLAGRKQSIKSIYLYLAAEPGKQQIPLELSWSLTPNIHEGKDESINKPEPRDVPLDAINRPEEFTKVLEHWISRDVGWKMARVRYDSCLEKGNSYDPDRLIAAANMFDILPDQDVPCELQLTTELAEAQSKCLEIFRSQVKGNERDSMIGHLSRMAKPSLPKKVSYRANIVLSRFGGRFPDLNLVVQTAVKLRNFYVHGGTSGLNIKAIQSLSTFLTDSLEFVFVASDLIEAGWDAGKWSNGYLSHGHSFSRFMSDYAERLNELRVALKKT